MHCIYRSTCRLMHRQSLIIDFVSVCVQFIFVSIYNIWFWVVWFSSQYPCGCNCMTLCLCGVQIVVLCFHWLNPHTENRYVCYCYEAVSTIHWKLQETWCVVSTIFVFWYAYYVSLNYFMYLVTWHRVKFSSCWCSLSLVTYTSIWYQRRSELNSMFHGINKCLEIKVTSIHKVKPHYIMTSKFWLMPVFTSQSMQESVTSKFRNLF